MKTSILLFTFLTIHNCSLCAQSLFESGNLFNKVEGIISNLPGPDNDDYVVPTNVELLDWSPLLQDLWEMDLSHATMRASQLNYNLIEFTDTSSNSIYYILQSKELNGNFWGTYVFNPMSCQTNLVIESPHPVKDRNTGKQGIHIFQKVSASFFLLAGTNRCNSSAFTSCSGTTKVCSGSSEDYRITDMAHVENSIFQKTHEFLFDLLPDPFMIQLHGFSWSSDSGLPNLIMSNGISIPPAGNDYLNILGQAVKIVDSDVSYGVEHITPSLPLAGTTNTQGRYCNGSNNPCNSFGIFNSGRFFHLEQSYTYLRQYPSDWDKLAEAIDMVFRNVDSDKNLSTGYYRTKDTLTLSSQISAHDSLILKGGKSIILNPGFGIPTGGKLEISIDTCKS